MLEIAKKPEWKTDATPERLARARESDLDTEYVEFVSAVGKLERRRRILCVLDTLQKKSIISSIQRDAGKMYLDVVDHATIRARMTMAYHSEVDNGYSKFDLLDFIELKTDAFRSARAAQLSVYPYARLALGWLVETLATDKQISTLGAMYAGIQTLDAQEKRGLAILRLALDCLAHHFRIADLKPRSPEIERWLEFLSNKQ